MLVIGRLNTTMKFKGQGKINICGFEYKINIADSRRGGGGVRAPQKNLYPRLTQRLFLSDYFSTSPAPDARWALPELMRESRVPAFLSE